MWISRCNSLLFWSDPDVCSSDWNKATWRNPMAANITSTSPMNRTQGVAAEDYTRAAHCVGMV